MLHLQKLSVGSESVEDLSAWQATPRAQAPDGKPRHVTRMWPKRAEELLDGGSIYWVIKGMILCRQRLLRLDPYEDAEGVVRCAIVSDPELVRVVPTPRRPFQGWRYLKPEDAPRDLTPREAREAPLPASLSAALAEIGVL